MFKDCMQVNSNYYHYTQPSDRKLPSLKRSFSRAVNGICSPQHDFMLNNLYFLMK